MKLKFVVAGPKGSGKTLISNCIAGQSDKLTTESYNPTVGVRILETELRLNGIHDDINVEIWDASGDQKYDFVFILMNCLLTYLKLSLSRYEAGWKAVLAYTDGVILVYDPDSPGQDQQLTLWYDYFVKRNGLRDEQCLIFAHRGNSTEKFKPRKFNEFFFTTIAYMYLTKRCVSVCT